MKLQRHRAVLGLLAGSGLLLTACGSDTGGGVAAPSTNPGGAVAITLVELGLSLPGVRTALNVDRGMVLLRSAIREAESADVSSEI